MAEAPPDRPLVHVAAGVLLALAALGALLGGRRVFSGFVAIVLLLSYAELHRLLTDDRGVVSAALGGAGVLGFLWVAYEGRLDRFAWIAGALVLALLVWGVLSNEATRRPHPATESVGATLVAAGIVGVLGSHIVLLPAMPVFGFRGVVVLGLMVFTNDAFALLGGRAVGRRPLAAGLSPHKTWEGAAVGFGASVGVGVVAGLALNPPFDLRSGLAFGAGAGILSPLGDLAFSALKRSAGRKESGRVFGPLGGALDAVDGVLLTAPAFYWAFRTIAT